MKPCLFLIIIAAAVAASLSLDAQEPAKPLPETRIVLRVSRKFIQCLVGREFERDEPFNSNVGGVAVVGKAHVTGKLQVVLLESETESNFDVLASGTVLTQMTATTRPVKVMTHGTAPFNARRRIVNKADTFTAEAVTVEVRHHSTLDEICSSRRGLFGAATRKLAAPKVRRSLPDGDRKADDEIRQRLTQTLETESDKLAGALSEIPPMVEQAHALIIRELKLSPDGVKAYRAATKEHLLLSVGEPNQRLPALPTLAKDKAASIELWIGKSKDALKEERRKFVLENWRLIAPILLGQIQRRSPELTKDLGDPLARLIEEVNLIEVGDWHVITLAPKIHGAIVDPP